MAGATTQRSFSWDDVPRVHELISHAWSERGARNYLHIGDFYWSLRPSENFHPERDLFLWETGGQLAAFAWYDGPVSGEFVVRPDAPSGLEVEVVSWLEARHREAGGDTSFTIAAIDDDDDRTAMLTGRGYARHEGGAVRFHQHIDSPPPPRRCPKV